MKYLFAGLGNPGPKYKNTRHNAGAEAVRSLLLTWQEKKDYLVATENFGQSEIIFVLPTTFMNESGLAIKKALNDFNLKPEHLIVVHDDADLSLGQTKLSFSSGSAGHRGVDSIIEHVGTKDFWRLRYGLGRPEGLLDITEFVLESWLENEKEPLQLFSKNLKLEIENLKKTGHFFSHQLI